MARLCTQLLTLIVVPQIKYLRVTAEPSPVACNATVWYVR